MKNDIMVDLQLTFTVNLIMENCSEDIMLAILTTVGRSTFSVFDVFDLVDPTGKSSKQVKAFNMADGTKTQSDICKTVKIDPGNFSKSLNKWIQEGVMFRLGSGRDAKLLHVFPLPSKRPKDL